MALLTRYRPNREPGAINYFCRSKHPTAEIVAWWRFENMFTNIYLWQVMSVNWICGAHVVKCAKCFQAVSIRIKPWRHVVENGSYWIVGIQFRRLCLAFLLKFKVTNILYVISLLALTCSVNFVVLCVEHDSWMYKERYFYRWLQH